MKYVQESVVFNEVPNEISLCYSISGCKKYCKGCHSKELWEENDNHFDLTEDYFTSKLNSYKGMITAICFLGGDWYINELINFLKISKTFNLKTCLYTYENDIKDVNIDLIKELDFIKIGEFKQELGGLNNPLTNQKFINLKTGENLNHLFKKNN